MFECLFESSNAVLEYRSWIWLCLLSLRLIRTGNKVCLNGVAEGDADTQNRLPAARETSASSCTNDA